MSNELFRAGCWHDLVFEDDSSSKFWSIKILKDSHIRKWGPTGQDGRELITAFADHEEARKDAERLFKAKLSSGYRVAKPSLQRVTELIHTVDHDELDRFFTQVYGVPFEFAFDQEASNYSSHRFVTSDELDEYTKKEIAKWIKSDGGRGYMTGALLDDCVRQKLIPDGTYIVEVCW